MSDNGRFLYGDIFSSPAGLYFLFHVIIKVTPKLPTPTKAADGTDRQLRVLVYHTLKYILLWLQNQSPLFANTYGTHSNAYH